MKKFVKNTLPAGHDLSDFKCFGPPATKDGEFEGTKICDMGCFTQDGKDSNKYYHACVAQSKLTNKWYMYLEFGRVGGPATYQIIEFTSEYAAEAEYCKRLHSKNDKRGEWINDPHLGTILRAKKGKDCYLVRENSSRNVGLPDGRNITTVQSVKMVSKKNYDKEVIELLKDLSLVTNEYTRSSMVDGYVPSLKAIEEARKICGLAAATKDKEKLEHLTSLLYSKIPKVKNKGDNYLLSNDNIKMWLDDLDAFEASVDNTACELEFDDSFQLEYIKQDSDLHKFLSEWMGKASRNKHYIGNLKILNIWKINKPEYKNFEKHQEKLLGIKIKERPLHQTKFRKDLDKKKNKLYFDTNTSMMFHGTRSVNVGGILRKSLMLPKMLKGVTINGAMFGPGLYWADDWRKSAGYTSVSGSYWSRGSGAIQNRGGFMFIADVILGNPFVAPGSRSYNEPPKGHHSVFGKMGHSGVMNNEFITYQTETNNLKYLVEFKLC